MFKKGNFIKVFLLILLINFVIIPLYLPNIKSSSKLINLYGSQIKAQKQNTYLNYDINSYDGTRNFIHLENNFYENITKTNSVLEKNNDIIYGTPTYYINNNYTSRTSVLLNNALNRKIEIPYPGDGNKFHAAMPNGIFTEDMINYGYWKETTGNSIHSLAPGGGAWFLAGLIFPKATYSDLQFLIVSQSDSYITIHIDVNKIKYTNGQFVDPYTRYFYVFMDNKQVYFAYISASNSEINANISLSISSGNHNLIIRIYNGNYAYEAYTLKTISIINRNTPDVYFGGIIFPKASLSQISWYAYAGKDSLIDFGIRRLSDTFCRFIRIYLNNTLIKDSQLTQDYNYFSWHLGDYINPYNSSKETLVKVTLEIYFGGYSSMGWSLYSETFTHLGKYIEVDYSGILIDNGELESMFHNMIYYDFPYIELYYKTHSFTRIHFIIDDKLPYSDSYSDTSAVWNIMTYGQFYHLRDLYFDNKDQAYWDYLLIGYRYEVEGCLGIYFNERHDPLFHRDYYNPNIFRDYGSNGVFIALKEIQNYANLLGAYATRTVVMHEVGHTHGILYVKFDPATNGFYESYSNYTYDVMHEACYLNTFFDKPFYSEFYWNLRLLYIYT